MALTDDAVPEVVASVAIGAEPRPLRRIEALAEMLLCSGFPSQLALSLLVSGAGIAATDGTRLLLPFVATVSLADTVVVCGLMVWLMRRRGERPAALWLGTRPVSTEMWHGLMVTPALLLAVGAILALVQYLAPHWHNVQQNPLEAMARGGLAQAALLGVVAVVAGAMREELQRGFLLDRFERAIGPAWLGVPVLSVAFGLGHVMQGWDAAVATALLGAFWAVLFVRRRSVVMALTSHACFNSLEIVRMLLVVRP